MKEKNKPKPKKKHYVRMCPKCKSLETTTYKDGGIASTGAIPYSFECLKCGFVGRFFPEVAVDELEDVKTEVDAEKKQEPTKDKDEDYKKVDDSYGKFYVRGFWKIARPFTLLIGVIVMIVIFSDIGDPNLSIIGIIILALGLLMSYFAYRKLPNKNANQENN